MTDLLATRMSSVPFSGIRRIFNEASRLEQEGADIIHLEIGRPDFDTPLHIKEAAKKALDEGQVHYTVNAGILALRRAIADKLKLDTELEYAAEDEIIVTIGASEAIYLAMVAFVNAGEEVLVPSIGWVNYQAVPHMVSGKISTYAVREETGFQVQASDIENAITPRTKLLVLTSPGNPTGGVVEERTLEGIARLVQEHNLLVLSDEIYEKIVYDDARHVSIASLPGMRERTIVVNGFSKTYSMTGWRLGYAAAPRELAAPMLKAHQYITTSAVSFAQAAGVAALRGSQECVAQMVGEFKRRRDLLVPALNAIPGVRCCMPRGAFYAFPNIRAFGLDSDALAWRLLREAQVAVVPGTAFGAAGEGYVRLSFANSYENIERAVERIARALERLPRQTA